MSDVFTDADRYRRNWTMADDGDFLKDEKHVVMRPETLSKFLYYDRSDPTGVWVGKKWLRRTFKRLDLKSKEPLPQGTEITRDLDGVPYIFNKTYMAEMEPTPDRNPQQVLIRFREVLLVQ